MDSQASSLMPCLFQNCCLAPEGPARPHWTLTPSPGELGSKKQLWLKRSAPRPTHVDAFTRGNDLPRNPAKHHSFIGEVQVSYRTILAHRGEAGKRLTALQERRLAAA